MMRHFPRDHRPGLFWASVRTTRENDPILACRARADHGFAIAESAEVHGQRICVALVLKDRKYELALDTTGEQSDHWNRCHTTISVTRKRRLGLIDTIWSSEPPLPTRIDGWEHALARIAELAKLACIEGDCEHPDEFEGWFGPSMWGEPTSYDRPDVFSDRSHLPASVEMLLQPPPFASEHQTLARKKAAAETAIAAILPEAQRVRAALRRAARRRRHTNRKSRAVRKSTPTELAQRKRADRHRPCPYFGPDPAAYASARSAFLADYDHAKSAFRRNQTVVFPAGTVRFRKLGARCRSCGAYSAPPLLVTRPPP